MRFLRSYLRPRFVMPPSAEARADAYLPGYATYSDYNYFKANPVVAWIKRRHFEAALEMTSPHFHRARVIDFGCGDGPFLPSLAKYFPEVVAIDQKPNFVEHAARVAAGLANVRVLCNQGLSFDQLRGLLGHPFDIAFVLETLEHIGEKERLYESKVEFLAGLASLLSPGGLIVASVPVMVGLPFLLQRLGLWAFRLHREPITWNQLFDSVLFSDTTALEPHWEPTKHLGFNHKKLLRRVRSQFEVVREWNELFQVVFLLRKK